MLVSLLISLLLTIILEVNTSYVIGVRSKNDIMVVMLVNVCTNPVVVYIANLVKMLDNKTIYWGCVAIMEYTVIIVEWRLFRKYLQNKEINCLCLSLANNIVSFGIGLVINYFI